MTETKTFHVKAVLSVVTGILLCDIEEVYKIMSWMTGQNLMTHQLPRAFEPCKEFLVSRFPNLKDIHVPENFKPEECLRYCNNLETLLPSEFEIPVMPKGEFYTPMHPLDEPILKGKNVIVIQVENEE